MEMHKSSLKNNVESENWLQYRVKRSHFTLLELLIVMMVLALTTGTIAFNINKALREQHFKTEVELVVDYLRLAQNLMLIMNVDTHVIFENSKSDGSNLISLKIDENLDDRLLEVVTSKQKKLDYIRFIDFHDENRTTVDLNKIDVKFISKGSVMSKGLLRLATTESTAGGLQKYICLAGYPKSIYSISEKTDDPSCHESAQDFDQRLIQFTVQEIQSTKPQRVF